MFVAAAVCTRAGLAYVVGGTVLRPLDSSCPSCRLLALAVSAQAAPPCAGSFVGAARCSGLGLALFVLAVADPGRLLFLNRGARPPRIWDLLSGEAGPAAIYRADPSQPPGDPVTVVWVVALLALLAWTLFARRHDRIDGWFRGLGLPLLLLLAVGAFVDGWARAGAPTAPVVFPSSGEGRRGPRRVTLAVRIGHARLRGTSLR